MEDYNYEAVRSLAIWVRWTWRAKQGWRSKDILINNVLYGHLRMDKPVLADQ